MNYTATLHPALTMEDCEARIVREVTSGGMGNGKELDRYCVETASGPVLVLLMDRGSGEKLAFCAVLDMAEGGRLRVHLSSGDDDEYSMFPHRRAKRLVQRVEEALQSVNPQMKV